MAKILLVEDDVTLRDVYLARLQADNHTVLVAFNVDEALQISNSEKPDLIIADVMMPKATGYDLLKKLKEIPELKDIKVIMMSALSQPEDKKKAMDLGAAGYIIKAQMSLEDIVQTINNVLQPKK